MVAATGVLDEVDEMVPKEQKTSPVRITPEAVRWARIASGYTGESMAEYISRIVVERGKADVERLHAGIVGEAGPKRKGGAK
jgi:hypothetical protein